uniref:unconventional myosin-XVIIIa isoform X5 n=1 Tax=Vespula vulgaris TaxID=7454 RepID=UPI00212DB426|nr:unconventional myosin-XVIIIa isoform X5 [Vespula vulgaris]
MLDNATKWMSSGSSRLLKAKSNPNISKMSPSNNKEANSRSKHPSRLNESTTINNNNKTTSRVNRSTSRTPSKGEQTTSVRVASSPNVDLSKTRGQILSKNRRAISESPIKLTCSQKNDKKKSPIKSTVSSSSCTILEDRSLLKKGLTYAPAKLPKKPEALRKNLDRSISLLNVPKETSSLIVQISNEKSKKDEATKKRQSMNRSISMWNVQSTSKMEVYSNNQSKRNMPISTMLCSRPSKIPLLAGRTSSLGRSLADLSQVDRSGESTLFRFAKTNVVNVIEPDLDRSIDERIYENCREAIGERVLDKEESSPRIGTNLEERAARLMAELDDDDNDNGPTTMNRTDEGEIKGIIDSVDRVDGALENSEKSSKNREILVSNEMKLTDRDKKKMEETTIEKESTGNIKELRCNWERQSRDIKEEKQEVKKIVVSNDTSDNKKKLLGKRTKEIEHLVNFFNCKNAESSSTTNENTRDPWIKSKNNVVPGYSSIESNLKKNNRESKNTNSEYNNGYVSDGNCSEDSGHISNENEVEWKDGGQSEQLRGSFEKERGSFFEDIPRNEEDRTIGVFDSSSHVVRRFVRSEKKEIVMVTKNNPSASSEASSIDSCREDVSKSISGYEVSRDSWKTPRSAHSTGSNVGKQIFFRSGTLERLEAQRDEKLTGHIILLQARCRGYLARRKLNTLKLQDLAVRCIQRNVRKLMSVREWPWWRLYVKVAPLLNVHRTEDQLKARTEELEVLRAKVERLEQERNHLKHDNDKLEAKLSEMTADFAEEHSTSTLAAERIDAETSERLRLERELQDVTEANKNLQQTTERLEMELLYARAADLNGVASDGEDGEDGGVYRQRYEHAIRELEFTKRKMAQQHEDDLEQLVGLKKQLEKKLADAYEEVEEQRQVVGQWKRRVQKLNGEMHDLRLLLEEQTARNNLLEKKQRKFDSETQNLMNDLRQEKAQRERLAREKEIAIAEKFTIEQNLSDAKLEIELKEERLRTLSQELEELTFGGKTEEEVAQLKKAKHELEKRAKDQEEELDDLAGQVQLLEQAKLRLEMSIEQQRKEMRKEMQQRDEELEDVRGNALKKVKALESQLENEHEERTILLREKHELERRLVAIEEQDRVDRAADAETTQRLKRDLKRTRALLRDAQTMLERSKGDSTGKAALRQLKNQLEDAECARAAAVKAKQALEQELNETQATLEEATRLRSEAEDRANAANRERSELLSQLEENEEELAEVLKKYRAAVQQVSAEQAQLQEAQVQIAALEAEKSSLKDQLSELSQRLESVEQLGDPTANSLATRRLEFRTKELESKLELEQTTRARLETQIARLKESVEKLQTETALLRTKEQTAQDTARRLQRSLRDAREEASSALAREQEATRARRELEKSLEAAEAETKVARDDLRLALQRIDDLQSAIQGELDLDCSEEATSENSDSD